MDTRFALQSSIAEDGTITNKAKNLTDKMFKKAQKILRKNIDNAKIENKTSHVVQECVLSVIGKEQNKLAGIRMGGGFAALAALAASLEPTKIS